MPKIRRLAHQAAYPVPGLEQGWDKHSSDVPCRPSHQNQFVCLDLHVWYHYRPVRPKANALAPRILAARAGGSAVACPRDKHLRKPIGCSITILRCCVSSSARLSAQGMPGLFLTFEGGEASGKSTQVKRLERRLERSGRRSLTVHEPGYTRIGSAIRQLLLHASDGSLMRNETEVLLFAASRAQLVGEVVRPALEKGLVVVSDRFYDSTMVYQGMGRGLDLGFIRSLNDFAVGACHPDRTFLLDLEVEESRVRQMRRVRPVGREDR